MEYKENYIISVVLDLNRIPKILSIADPIKNLNFEKKIIKSNDTIEYHLLKPIC